MKFNLSNFISKNNLFNTSVVIANITTPKIYKKNRFLTNKSSNLKTTKGNCLLFSGLGELKYLKTTPVIDASVKNGKYIFMTSNSIYTITKKQ